MTVHGAPKTMAAASGSTKMLNSAAGVMLPGPCASHDHDLTDRLDYRRLLTKRNGNVREGPSGNEGQLTGSRHDRVNEKVDGVPRGERDSWHHGLGAIHPAFAVIFHGGPEGPQ